jgi:regulator of protease activity HflC (stomatin/prohibitin superfamily)
MDNATKRQFFLIFILISFLLLVYFVLDLFLSLPWAIKAIFLAIIVLIVFSIIFVKAGFILFLQEYERAVILRFGKLHRISGPGWALTIPGLENFTKVDLRVQTIDVAKQEVITKDNVAIKVDAIIFLSVKKDPKSVANSVLNVEDYKKAAQLFVKSSVREVIGNMVLSEVVSNINELNVRLLKELAKITSEWGINVESVELKEIIVPDIVIDAMHKQKAAEQERLAIIQIAEAEREKISAIDKSASQLGDKSISYYYIKALEEMSKGASTKIIFPMEFSRLAEILAGKVAPKANEKSKLENFLDKYGDLLEEKLEDVTQK